jgi:hypothetical protein
VADPPFSTNPFFAAAAASFGVGGSVMVGMGVVDVLIVSAFFAQKLEAEAAPLVLVVVDIFAVVYGGKVVEVCEWRGKELGVWGEVKRVLEGVSRCCVLLERPV